VYCYTDYHPSAEGPESPKDTAPLVVTNTNNTLNKARVGYGVEKILRYYIKYKSSTEQTSGVN
jgi:hypothetical protein